MKNETSNQGTADRDRGALQGFLANAAVDNSVGAGNQGMWRSAVSIACAIDELCERGFEAIGFQSCNHSTPTIQICVTAQCAALIERGEATYYYEGWDNGVRMRKGQLHIGRVRVIWIERGN